MAMKSYVPGVVLLLIISVASTFLAEMLPNYIGRVFIAVLLGVIINNMFSLNNKIFGPGVKLGLNKFLKIAIILLGAEVSFAELLKIGGKGLIVVISVIVLAFILTFLLGDVFKVSLRKKLLIAVGLSICGNTAIVTTAPLIDAEEEEIVMAVGIVTLFGVLAVFVFPLVGFALHMADLHFGAWVGTGVYDTSQVVAAGFAYSEESGRVATIIKLTRNVMMVPVIFSVGYFYRRNRKATGGKVRIVDVFPMFILGFLLMSLINSIGLLTPAASSYLVAAAKFLIVLALSGIGLSVKIADLKKLGWTPFVLGFSIASLIAISSYFMNYYIWS